MSVLTNFKIGDVLSFDYQGDNKPKRKRIARVQDVFDDYIHAMDCQIDQPRNFSDSKAYNVLKVGNKDQKIISRKNVLSSLFSIPIDLNIEDTIKLYKTAHPEIYQVESLKDLDVIVVTENKEEPTLDLEVYDDHYVLNFTNDNGEKLKLSGYDDGGFNLAVFDKNNSVLLSKDQPTIRDFIVKLDELFSVV